MPVPPIPRRPYPGQLLDAVSDNDINAVRRLLKQGSDVNELDASGNTPLARAAAYGYVDIAKVLIENKAELDSQNRIGNTPLMVAIITSYAPARIDFVRLLLEKGANLDVRNNRNETALDIATLQSRFQIMDALRSAAAERKRLAEEFARAAEAKRREQIIKSQQELKELSKKNKPVIIPKPPKAA